MTASWLLVCAPGSSPAALAGGPHLHSCALAGLPPTLQALCRAGPASPLSQGPLPPDALPGAPLSLSTEGPSPVTVLVFVDHECPGQGGDAGQVVSSQARAGPARGVHCMAKAQVTEDAGGGGRGLLGPCPPHSVPRGPFCLLRWPPRPEALGGSQRGSRREPWDEGQGSPSLGWPGFGGQQGVRAGRRGPPQAPAPRPGCKVRAGS